MYASRLFRAALSLIFVIVLLMPGVVVAGPVVGSAIASVRINEVRVDQTGTDYDEYFELYGTPSMSLDGYTYIVIGDDTPAKGSGVIEAIVPLSGQSIPASGYFVCAENTFTLGTADLTTTLNFENNDNVTHMLVTDFVGSLLQDLDTNDDGVFDVTPWSGVVDRIAIIMQENPPTSTEYHYGPPTIGPDGTAPPFYAYVTASGWRIGLQDVLAGVDTPGRANLDPPYAVNDSYSTNQNTALSITAPGVLENDTDPNGDPMTAALISGPSSAQSFALFGNGGFTYTPATDFVGVDQFVYRASDGTGGSNLAWVSITVNAYVPPPNNAPVAVDDAYETDEGELLTVAVPGVLGNDTDADGDTLTAVKVTDPASGTLALSADGGFTYTPDADFFGTDTFTYKADDGTDDSDTAVVTIIVNEADDEEPPLPAGAIRVAGTDRYLTGVEASKRGFDSADTVVIATGANWPDALGGSALAGAVGGPLLLTQPTVLPAAVRDEIGRLGATKIYILGGTTAVSPDVEAELAGLVAGNVERLSGTDRYGTARAIADETITLLGAGYEGGVLVATGANFPDATGASPLAAALGMPILLVNPVTAGFYLPTQATFALILGETDVVSQGVEDSLITAFGAGNVDRKGGATRYETAALVAQAGVDAGMSWNGVGLATGQNFPDALAGGAMLGSFNSVMLLTTPSPLHAAAEAKLAANAAAIDTLFAIGGETVVSPAALAEAKTAAGIP